jgi:hypothetical protein
MIKKIYAIVFLISLIIISPAFGMETYPCDVCQKEKTVLNERTKALLTLNSTYECLHILCKECNNTLYDWPRPQENKVWWGCPYCSYFYNERNKQCWRLKNRNDVILDSTGIGAKRFKELYPNRVIPDITDATLFPRHPRDPHNNNQGHNPNNPDNPPINNLVIDKKIQWLGAAGIGLLVCYGAYKAYHWWNGEDKKENDNEIDEWDNQKREGVGTLEV